MRLLRGAVACGICGIAWTLHQKLGRSAKVVQEDDLMDAWFDGSPKWAIDTIFYFYMHKNTDSDIRQPFFQAWAEDIAFHVPMMSLPFTPAITCEPDYSVLWERFDWQVMPKSGWMVGDAWNKWKNNATGLSGCGKVDQMPWKDDTTPEVDPKTVLVAPHGIQRLLNLAEARGLSVNPQNRTVVFMGTEMPLSKAFGPTPQAREATVAKLKRYFSRIVYMVKDIELEGVVSAPMGLCWGYYLLMLPNWVKWSNGTRRILGEAILDFEKNITTATLESKTRSVLATAGKVATWLESSYTLQQVVVFRRKGLLFPPSNSSLVTVSDAAESRRQMRAWAQSEAAAAAGVEYRKIETQVWYAELATYRFLLSPMGSAIQTSKTVEALLVLTVPIIQRKGYALHDELLQMGFPVVIIEGWDEITAEATDAWWRQLSPRLPSFRVNCLSVDGFWKLFTGQISFCQ